MLGGQSLNSMGEIELAFKIFTTFLFLVFFILRNNFISHYKKFTYRFAIKYIVLILLLFFYLSGLLDFASFIRNYAFRFLVGSLFTILGFFLFYFSHKALGENWSPIIEKRFHKSRFLVVKGPYKYLVHPIYTASILVFIGFGILTGNWVIGGVPLVILICFYFYKVPLEEAELRNNFGKKYLSYLNSRKRFIPGLW
jgi:protein-S-isoprenylcysteine O-methyltransferase Ste14